jgi:hypothetical protein
MTCCQFLAFPKWRINRMSRSNQPGSNQRSRGAIMRAGKYRHFQNARFSNSEGGQLKRSQKTDLRSRVDWDSGIVIPMCAHGVTLTIWLTPCKSFRGRANASELPDVSDAVREARTAAREGACATRKQDRTRRDLLVELADVSGRAVQDFQSQWVGLDLPGLLEGSRTGRISERVNNDGCLTFHFAPAGDESLHTFSASRLLRERDECV